MTNALPPGLTDCLLWSEELGMGFHPRPPMDYTGPYFEKYQLLDATPMGAALTQTRIDLVRRHFAGQVVDIGIGGGRFVTESGAMGFDVNPEAVDWLRAQERYYDPYQHHAEAVTCWDSLEHIPEPEKLLDHVGEWLFVSMPIYKDQTDCLSSKHYKPGEHIWYHTMHGLIGWCERQGFECVELNDQESKLGREGITSFAFRRVHG
ncbi:methyltransferase domain-containing protein [Pseudomonas aeruginosa]|uniref:methyltransferase domain-containing protein n=1 Tax=Pseudomonas aeruginosa TaxID=287 RepID=UPI0003C8B424|nr:methyltransferase domain-containing protein [Pseudomonas aeruginosa]AXS72199.1 hypothetical protein CTT40_03627 [Pseudomonas aeruginosa]EIU1456045.1 methyltransferase domain-containing protein [Pseudomonas aeruginosa]EIU3804038.1 methyltransferase domain-containing protein [Pseudomonas aeruginosa]EIU3955385.1 methyltransferase domain-containing protein [Pseudomonas aeruginosa]EIU3967472.1 methyltransferase domain-containing protein [Pseudomonas aeruginosa]